MNGAARSLEEERTLEWRELSGTIRAALERRLEGLYGGANDRAVFDALSIDKQQALLILVRRFLDLKLWDAVRRVENVYGESGVGMNFSAWPYMKSTLERSARFTKRFAAHDNTTGGFIERGRTRASLHILYADGSATRCWEAHFDLFNPLASPLNAWRHLLYEKIRRETPDWRVIGASLGYLKSATSSAIS